MSVNSHQVRVPPLTSEISCCVVRAVLSSHLINPIVSLYAFRRIFVHQSGMAPHRRHVSTGDFIFLHLPSRVLAKIVVRRVQQTPSLVDFACDSCVLASSSLSALSRADAPTYCCPEKWMTLDKPRGNAQHHKLRTDETAGRFGVRSQLPPACCR